MKLAIQPYAVGPRSANQLEIFETFYSTLGQAPTFNYSIQEKVVTPAATLGDPDVVTETPLLPNASVQMKLADWQAWPAGGDAASDAAYVAACIVPLIPGVKLA